MIALVLFLGTILLLASFALVYFPTLQNNSVTSSKNVILTKDGFTPKTLTIRKGQKVMFSTQMARSFWPASDLHPTHELYGEFDPKKPIQKDASWSFTFKKPGKWKYHDHLFPYFRGEIIVTE